MADTTVYRDPVTGNVIKRCRECGAKTRRSNIEEAVSSDIDHLYGCTDGNGPDIGTQLADVIGKMGEIEWEEVPLFTEDEADMIIRRLDEALDEVTQE